MSGISNGYLKYLYSIGRNIFPNIKHGEESKQAARDMALDCIADLFQPNKQGRFKKLEDYFSKNKISSVSLRAIVCKTTQQELVRIFRERDPQGSRIVRNIKNVIKNSKNVGSFDENGHRYVFLKENIDCLRKDEKYIPEDILRDEYLRELKLGEKIPNCMRKMLLVLKNHEEYRNFLPLGMIIKIILHTSIDTMNEYLRDKSKRFEDDTSLELVGVKNMLRSLEEKIGDYIKDDKITKETGDIYYKALFDMVRDINDGIYKTKGDSAFDYLKRYLPSLTVEIYRKQNRSIFEYLVRLVKKHFKDLLEKTR